MRSTTVPQVDAHREGLTIHSPDKRAVEVRLVVVDLLGRGIAQLVDETLPAGGGSRLRQIREHLGETQKKVLSKATTFLSALGVSRDTSCVC